MKLKSIYGRTVRLKKALREVECWNFTSKEVFTLPVGTLVKLTNVYDATYTTVEVVDKTGKCVGMTCKCSDGERIGYRFIVANEPLAKATGFPVPKKNRDLIGEMMAFEAGELDEAQAKRLLVSLKEANMLSSLQGFYGRTARALGVI